MAKWHFQVFRYGQWDEDGNDTEVFGYGIHEWYDQPEGPIVTEEPVPIVAESVDELKALLQDMLRDIELYGVKDYDNEGN